MAHLVDDKAIAEDKNMEIDDTSDARFASILHSRALVSLKHFYSMIICADCEQILSFHF